MDKINFICVTCLTAERSLTPVKKLFYYTNIWHDVQLKISDVICWECEATFKRMYRFKQRVLMARDVLLSNHTSGTTTEYESLSNLILSTKTTYDLICSEEQPIEVIKLEVEDFDCDYLKCEDANELLIRSIDTNKQDMFELNEPFEDDTYPQKLVDPCVENVKIETTKTNEEFTNKEQYFSMITMTEKEMMKARKNDKSSARYKKCPYKCESCILGYFKKDWYERHMMQKHSKEAGTFICGVCEVRFQDKEAMHAHAKLHYNMYRCNMCDYENYKLNTILLHHSKEHENVTHACKMCNAEFSSKSRLRYHKLTNHKALPTCSICNQTLSTQNSLKEHMLRHTTSAFRHKCDLCNKVYRSERGLRRHVVQRHETMLPSENAYCAECDIQFLNVYTYRSHLKLSAKHRSEDSLKFKCQKCNKCFTQRIALNRHIGSFHSDKSNFVCHVCNKGFIRKDRLKDHIMYKHEGVAKPRKHLCTYCDKRFTERKILNNHIRTHTGDKPFECEYCTASFAQRSAMKTHVKGVHMKMWRKSKTK